VGIYRVAEFVVTSQVSDFMNERNQKRILIEIVVNGDEMVGPIDGRAIIAKLRISFFGDFQFEIELLNPHNNLRHRPFGNVLQKNGSVAFILIHESKNKLKPCWEEMKKNNFSTMKIASLLALSLRRAQGSGFK
jgi:hypothetical protein